MKFKKPYWTDIKDNGDEWHVVGVMKDFIYESPYEKYNSYAVLRCQSMVQCDAF